MQGKINILKCINKHFDKRFVVEMVIRLCQIPHVYRIGIYIKTRLDKIQLLFRFLKSNLVWFVQTNSNVNSIKCIKAMYSWAVVHWRCVRDDLRRLWCISQYDSRTWWYWNCFRWNFNAANRGKEIRKIHQNFCIHQWGCTTDKFYLLLGDIGYVVQLTNQINGQLIWQIDNGRKVCFDKQIGWIECNEIARITRFDPWIRKTKFILSIEIWIYFWMLRKTSIEHIIV